tara:strand:- start:13005 stop:13553 length:549 start_codon:yes stop_codon:yes gene_type:complete
MKQLSIYDNEYLDGFDVSSHVKPAIRSVALYHEHPVTTPLIEPVFSDFQPSHDIEDQKAFPANVTEIVLTKDKIDSIQLILPMLINLHQEKRWLAWIDPPIKLLKEWQKTHQDSALNDIMILRSNDNLSVFELSKRALEAGTCHAVIAWTNNLNHEEFSKLETASSIGNSHGIILKSRLKHN